MSRDGARYYESLWGAAEDRSLERMRNAHVTVDVMAERLGRTPGAVRRRLRIIGLTVPKEVPDVPWTELEDGVLRAGLAAGDSYSTVGARLGRTRSSVAGRVARLKKQGLQ